MHPPRSDHSWRQCSGRAQARVDLALEPIFNNSDMLDLQKGGCYRENQRELPEEETMDGVLAVPDLRLASLGCEASR